MLDLEDDRSDLLEDITLGITCSTWRDTTPIACEHLADLGCTACSGCVRTCPRMPAATRMRPLTRVFASVRTQMLQHGAVAATALAAASAAHRHV